MAMIWFCRHTVNTDQWRMVLQYTKKPGLFSYSASVPANPGVALPGFWMLFALTEDGVPSVATFVEITMDEIFGRREGGTSVAFVVRETLDNEDDKSAQRSLLAH
ncbi:MAG: hypothetical protein Q9161_009227 [Pseudevernia consocians]